MSSETGRVRPRFALDGRQGLRLLLAILATVHLPLLINQGWVMDDFLVLQIEGSWPVELDFLLRGAGHPVFWAQFKLLNATGAPGPAAQVLAMSGILGGAATLYAAALRLGLASPAEAALVAFVVWTYPGYELWAGKANAVYVFSFALFCLGVWLLARSRPPAAGSDAPQRERGAPAAAYASLVPFFLSFALNSLMTLYLLVLAGLAWTLLRERQASGVPRGRAMREALRAMGTRYLPLVLLPVAYWLMLTQLFPRQGVYLDHYRFAIPDLPHLLDILRAFFRQGYKALYETLTATLDSEPGLLVVLALCVAGAAALLLLRDRRRTPRLAAILWPAGLAIAACLLIVVPYAVAQLLPNSHFYESRHLLLLGVPLALAVLAGKRLLDRLLPHRRLGLALAVPLIGALVFLLLEDYAFLQARALKLQALQRDLAEQHQRPPATVFALEDQFLDGPGRHDYFGVGEITGAMRGVWGRVEVLGFTRRHEGTDILRNMAAAIGQPTSAWRHMDPGGPQARLYLQRGPTGDQSNMRLVAYYYLCLLGGCDLDRFIENLAEVRVEPTRLEGIEAVEPQG